MTYNKFHFFRRKYFFINAKRTEPELMHKAFFRNFLL